MFNTAGFVCRMSSGLSNVGLLCKCSQMALCKNSSTFTASDNVSKEGRAHPDMLACPANCSKGKSGSVHPYESGSVAPGARRFVQFIHSFIQVNFQVTPKSEKK